MLFLANFYPPPPITHPETPRKYVTHLGPPRFLEGLVQKPGQKPPCTNSVSIVGMGFCPGVLSEGLLPRRFCPGWFLSVPVLSEYICYIRKLNITLNFMFRMYNKIFYKCDVTCSLLPLPLSQTVTPSRTPSPLERDVLYGRPLSHLCISHIPLYFHKIYTFSPYFRKIWLNLRFLLPLFGHDAFIMLYTYWTPLICDSIRQGNAFCHALIDVQSCP